MAHKKLTKEGGRMQKKHTNGLFIDSSCRRTGLLKTLLQGFRNERHDEEAEAAPYGQEDRSFSPSGTPGSYPGNENSQMKKVVSL
jgi:hypothetical protein